MKFWPWRRQPSQDDILADVMDEVFGHPDERRMHKWSEEKLLEQIHGTDLSPARRAQAQVIFDRRMAWKSPPVRISIFALVVSCASMCVALIALLS